MNKNRNNKQAAGLWALFNFIQVLLSIFLRRINEAERANLADVRRAKILQDISISRTRQNVLQLKSDIESRTKNDHNERKVEKLDLDIEIQRLKVLELQKKLGLTAENFDADNYDLNAFADDAGLQRPPKVRR